MPPLAPEDMADADALLGGDVFDSLLPTAPPPLSTPPAAPVPAARPRCYIGGITDPGVPGRQNQDDFFMWRSADGRSCCLGVFDGHGRELGQQAAAAAAAYVAPLPLATPHPGCPVRFYDGTVGRGGGTVPRGPRHSSSPWCWGLWVVKAPIIRPNNGGVAGATVFPWLRGPQDPRVAQPSHPPPCVVYVNHGARVVGVGAGSLPWVAGCASGAPAVEGRGCVC